MNHITTILDMLSPAVRVWVALVISLAGLVLTAVGTARGDATLTAVGAALTLAGGVVVPSGSGRPPGGAAPLALLVLLLASACAPAVSLGTDAIRTTCATCRRIAPACDAVSPAPSASAAP